MIIVAGWLRIADGMRDSYVDGCREVVEAARAAEGCLDFALTADPIQADRVWVFERWAAPEALARFRGAGPEPAQAERIVEAQVQRYHIAATEPA